jgi:carboxyl-terminal processing protease
LDTLRASGNEALVKIPVVVLIDKGSASASEILSGALRDDRKVKLVGDTSFGKGTVQEFMDLKDGSTLKLTIAHWVLPSGRILDHDGLVPDYAVKLTDEDIAAKRDPQFDKALEVLKSEMK